MKKMTMRGTKCLVVCLLLSLMLALNVSAEEQQGEPEADVQSTVQKKEKESEETVKAGNDDKNSNDEKNMVEESHQTTEQINDEAKIHIEKKAASKEKAVVKSIKMLKPSLKTVNYIYDGKNKKPSVLIKNNGKSLVLNKDYTVKYESCKEIGKAKAIVIGKGNYKDTVTLFYNIKFGNIPYAKAEVRTYNSIRIKWRTVPGANGYVIYRSTSPNKGFKVIGKVTNKSTKAYADKNLKFNKTYYYKLRPYRVKNGKKVYGDYTKVLKQKVKLTTLSAPSSKSLSYNSIRLSWKRVAGADGYAVYRSNSKNGKYNRIATLKSKYKTKYTDKKRSCGKLYYYKVRAYRKVGKKNVYAGHSASKAVRTVPTKTNFDKNSELYSTKVILRWSRSTGAAGYEIYRKTSSKIGYVKVKTITKGSTTRWTNSGLKKGRTYYYRIRPYRTVNGKKVYGAFSATYKKSNKGGWKYKNGYKLYYDNKGKLVKDVDKIIGKQSSYIIKVNKKKNVVTVYAKDGKKGYIIPVKAFVCSTGQATPLGTFRTPAKYRWHTLMGPSYGQWDTRVVGGILFHSVFYSRPKNNMTLSVSAYNKLGTTASHGCIRLAAADAKWIYDNCKLRTKVVIYNSSSSGPFGKPKAKKLASWHTWDPTDPTAKYKCRQKGCH